MNKVFTDKQEAFINHYVATLNGYESAKRAKYNGDYNTLCAIASQNLSKLKIRAEIDRRLGELIPTPNETLARIGEHARGTVEDFLVISDDYGNVLSLSTARARGKLGLVKKYKETKTTRTDKDGNEFVNIHKEVELYSADSALDKLMRHHGLYNDRTDITSGGEKLETAVTIYQLPDNGRDNSD